MKPHRLLVWLILCNIAPTSVHAAQTEPLPPLANYAKSFRPDNKAPDPTELAYFANRSAVLLALLSSYSIENGNTDKDKENGNKFKKLAEVYEFVRIVLDTAVTKKSPEFVAEQKKVFADFYFSEFKRGKLATNTIFTKQVSDDFNTALKYYPMFESMHKELLSK